jgi:hypothetical protein
MPRYQLPWPCSTPSIIDTHRTNRQSHTAAAPPPPCCCLTPPLWNLMSRMAAPYMWSFTSRGCRWRRSHSPTRPLLVPAASCSPPSSKRSAVSWEPAAAQGPHQRPQMGYSQAPPATGALQRLLLHLIMYNCRASVACICLQAGCSHVLQLLNSVLCTAAQPCYSPVPAHLVLLLLLLRPVLRCCCVRAGRSTPAGRPHRQQQTGRGWGSGLAGTSGRWGRHSSQHTACWQNNS